MTKKLATSAIAIIALASSLTFSSAAFAAKPAETPGKGSSQSQTQASNSGSKSNGSQSETTSAKPGSPANPAPISGSVEIAKPNKPSVDFVNVEKDKNGKPLNVEGQASFGNTKKLTAAEAKAAAAEKAAAKADAGNKLQYIIRFNEAANVTNEIAALKSAKATVGRQFTKVFKGLVAGLTDKQKEAFAKRQSIQSITEDAEVTATEIQSPTSSWGTDRIDQTDLPLSGSYTYAANGNGVDVYVVDTGIMASHSEFSGRVKAGFSAVADSNGTEDCNGHGTHVSSTAAGTVFGVAKQASLIPVRVLGCDGSGSISGVIAGLDWIAGQYTAGTPAVVNMSLGGGANSSLDTAVNSLINRGITVVVAAGNSSADACQSSPARVASAITVAATTSTDSLASYSNYGACVDLAAPGSSISGAWITSANASAVLSGTSMASPHVAGVAAMLLSAGYNAPNIVTLALIDSATKGKVTGLPTGTANALLFANPEGIGVPVSKAPVAPVNVVATAGKRAATVNWTLSDNGGLTIVSQTVKVWSGGNVVGSLKLSASATSATLKLRAGVSYQFTVIAATASAISADSALSNSVIPTNK